MSGVRYLTLRELLVIARAEGGDGVAKAIKTSLAESALAAPAAAFGDHEEYADLIMKAAVLTSRIARNHPFPDGNKRTARLAGLLFLEMNGVQVDGLLQHPKENDQVIRRLASSEMDEAAFADWMRERLSAGS